MFINIFLRINIRCSSCVRRIGKVLGKNKIKNEKVHYSRSLFSKAYSKLEVEFQIKNDSYIQKEPTIQAKSATTLFSHSKSTSTSKNFFNSHHQLNKFSFFKPLFNLSPPHHPRNHPNSHYKINSFTFPN